MQDLTVRSESIQRIYSFYINDKLLVNRRYQRKLVWTIDEKAAFIDSILKEYPVPLFLLAEDTKEQGSIFEIIDGMQRLDAITSFIEGQFSVEGKYFDLDSMAESKLLLDNGGLIQKTPKLERNICSNIFASYVLPLSIYKKESEEQIDEIFRRINSNGKHLSRQEIRQAGSVSKFAELVRLISSEIRGDVSLENRLLLNDMKKISITNKDLEYGINVDNVFWVTNSIIRREKVRESKDEEIVADILAYVLLDEKPLSSSNALDDFYGFNSENKKSKELDEKIKIRGIDKIKSEFFTVYDIIKSVVNFSNQKLQQLMFKEKSSDQIPRYFQIVFLALYQLAVFQNKKVSSIARLAEVFQGIGNHISLGQGGGNWSAKERETNIEGVVGILNKCFIKNLEDPAMLKWSTELETILRQSTTEQTCFDFKIGFTSLSKREFVDKTFDKVVKTLTAMANKGKGSVGYVIIGVADKNIDAEELEKITGEKSIQCGNFKITGINHDMEFLNITDDKYYQYIIQKLDKQPISPKYKSSIGNLVRFMSYGNKKVIIFKINALDEPAFYDNKYYERKGANIAEIEMTRVVELTKRFL
ncbi:GmrSD restriction endonuclease domain-containing protein [Anaerocolumna chitinilytica]|uniref:DUF262 domain-containing protein n=1 Tax=Anaerocolumna chitinilytica TaxID=1727145 RepID=A0A7I8DHZ4_9FIRM|nr:DUF262 domain-containing protein [Anaerocolumna chitinilytica]BCJ98093.1 hypothetical protein bsdcttw_11340 [Anaerocolumna chitinilytica]